MHRVARWSRPLPPPLARGHHDGPEAQVKKEFARAAGELPLTECCSGRAPRIRAGLLTFTHGPPAKRSAANTRLALYTETETVPPRR